MENLTACHVCDALCRDRPGMRGERISCPRCGTRLRTVRARAIDHLLAISLSVIPLMAVGVLAPFLSLSGGGTRRETDVLDAAIAVGATEFWQLAIVVTLLIVALPTFRAMALCYVLIPLRLGWPVARHAKAAFRMAIRLRPWSMAEIFVIGVAVALVKVAGLASVTLGPAFWAFVVLGVIVLLEDLVLCERSIWELLA